LADVVLKAYRVSCVDLGGIEHVVEVSANSLYEAVAPGAADFS
jgi:hypothetical protein